jgi:hypothetical protein
VLASIVTPGASAGLVASVNGALLLLAGLCAAALLTGGWRRRPRARACKGIWPCCSCWQRACLQHLIISLRCRARRRVRTRRRRRQRPLPQMIRRQRMLPLRYQCRLSLLRRRRRLRTLHQPLRVQLFRLRPLQRVRSLASAEHVRCSC